LLSQCSTEKKSTKRSQQQQEEEPEEDEDREAAERPTILAKWRPVVEALADRAAQELDSSLGKLNFYTLAVINRFYFAHFQPFFKTPVFF
jgi:hypothetical protein